MKTFGTTGIGSLVVVLLLAGAANAATLEITIEADRVASGNYDIRVYAKAVGTGASPGDGFGGIWGFPITLESLGSVGVTVPVKQGPKNVKTVWGVSGDHFFRVAAIAQDTDGDTDNDAFQMAMSDPSSSWANTDVGLGAVADLIGTQTWTMSLPQQTFVTATVGTALWYAGGTADDEALWANYFTNITINGQANGVGGVLVGPEGGEPVWEGPSAGEIVAGLYPGGVGEALWIEQNQDPSRWGWNNPDRELTLSVGGPPGGALTDAEWDFGGGLLKSGLVVTVNVGELLAAGWIGDPPSGDSYPVGITLIQEDGATSSTSMDVFLPEPGTMALLGLGCLGTILRRRRK